MAVQEYDPERMSQSAERALGILNRMNYGSGRIDEAKQYLEQALSVTEVEELYDNIESAYDTLSRHESYLEGHTGARIDPPEDSLPLRNAVSALDKVSGQD